jgi:Pex26 protein
MYASRRLNCSMAGFCRLPGLAYVRHYHVVVIMQYFDVCASVSSLLLHAELKDNVTCTVIANIWLKNPANFSSPDYRMLAETYVERVLLPLHRWDDVRPFLDSCPGLADSAKETYLRHVKTVQNRYVQSSADDIEVLETSEDSSVRPSNVSRVSHRTPDNATSDSGNVGLASNSLYRAAKAIYDTINAFTRTLI